MGVLRLGAKVPLLRFISSLRTLADGELRKRDAEMRERFSKEYGASGFGHRIPEHATFERFLNYAPLSKHQEEFRRLYPFLFLFEWDVVPGLSQHGRGDMVFAGSGANFAVLEIGAKTDSKLARQAHHYCTRLPDSLAHRGFQCRSVTAFIFHHIGWDLTHISRVRVGGIGGGDM